MLTAGNPTEPRSFWNPCCERAMKENARKCPRCRNGLPYRALAKDLRLGDIVTTMGGTPYERNRFAPFDAAVVNQIEYDNSDLDGNGNPQVKAVHLVRPYMQTSDFTYTGGVIWYIGVEQYSLYRTSDVLVLRETSVPECKREG